MRTSLARLAAAAGACALCALTLLPASAQYYSPPKFKHQVLPAYSDTARAGHETGQVFVKVLVMGNGTVPKNGITLFKGSGHRDLDAATMAAVKASTFSPGTRDGKPVVAFMDVIYKFTLQGVLEAGGNTSDLARKLGSNPHDTATRLALATGYLNKQQYSQAESILKEGVGLDPNNAKMWARLGIAYYGDGVQSKDESKYKEAADAFDKALSLDPHVDTAGVAGIAYNRYAFGLLQNQQYAAALPYAQKAAQLDPKRSDNQLLIGDANTGIGNYQTALAAYKNAQSLDDHKNATITSNILARVGNAELALGDETAGIAAITQAEQASARNPAPYQALASYYIKKGNFNAALSPLKQLLALNPNDPHVLTNISAIEIQQKNYTQAKADAQKALSIDPNNGDALFGMAQLSASQGDTGTADSYLQKAIAANKSAAADYNDAIAKIYLQETTDKQNHAPDAERYANAATQANPNDADAWYSLGIAYADEGKQSLASDALKKAYTIFKASGNADGASAAAKYYKQVTGTDISG